MIVYCLDSFQMSRTAQWVSQSVSKEHERSPAGRNVRLEACPLKGCPLIQLNHKKTSNSAIARLYYSFAMSRKWMTTDSAANSLLNNNCFSISATAFITNIHSSYDRRQISRHSWNCSPTKQRREYQNKLHLETSFLTNISNLVAIYFCFCHHAFSLLRHCNQTPYSSYCRQRAK